MKEHKERPVKEDDIGSQTIASAARTAPAVVGVVAKPGGNLATEKFHEDDGIETFASIDIRTRIGFPPTKPTKEPYGHGWFFPQHKVVLSTLLSEKTTCVVELGSWLGMSTRFIAKHAPNARIFAVDLWSNKFMQKLQMDHYAATIASDGSERGRGGHENATVIDIQKDIIMNHDLFDTFLVNMWKYRDRIIDSKTGQRAGIVPFKMSTLTGLDRLKAIGIKPDVIYIDADHHYAPAKADIERCIQYFPDAHICGDDWDYDDVRRAATELGKKYGRKIHAEEGKCWTYAATPEHVKKYAERRKDGRETVLNTKNHRAKDMCKRLMTTIEGPSIEGGSMDKAKAKIIKRIFSNFDDLRAEMGAAVNLPFDRQYKYRTVLMQVWRPYHKFI